MVGVCSVEVVQGGLLYLQSPGGKVADEGLVENMKARMRTMCQGWTRMCLANEAEKVASYITVPGHSAQSRGLVQLMPSLTWIWP